MDVTPKAGANAQVIQSYGAAGFKIAGIEYPSSVLVTSNHTLPWAITRIENMTIASFEPLLAEQPALEILLIGTGACHALIDRALHQSLRAKGLQVDSMDTGAACRTFNILLLEGRRVGAALLLPR